MAEPVETVHHQAENVQEDFPVGIVAEDVSPGVASAGRVANGTVKLQSQRG